MTARRPDLSTRGYRTRRAQLIGQPCWRGCGRTATTADHVPPLAQWAADHPGQPWQGELRPSCAPCQHIDGGWRLVNRLRQHRATSTQRGTRWS